MVQLVLKKKFVGYFHFQSGNEQGDWILGVGVHVLNDWLLRLQPQLLSAIGLSFDVLLVSSIRYHREQKTRFTTRWLVALRTGRFQFLVSCRALPQRFARHGETSPLDWKRNVIHVFLNFPFHYSLTSLNTENSRLFFLFSSLLVWIITFGDWNNEIRLIVCFFEKENLEMTNEINQTQNHIFQISFCCWKHTD